MKSAVTVAPTAKPCQVLEKAQRRQEVPAPLCHWRGDSHFCYLRSSLHVTGKCFKDASNFGKACKNEKGWE